MIASVNGPLVDDATDLRDQTLPWKPHKGSGKRRCHTALLRHVVMQAVIPNKKTIRIEVDGA
jgi:hypothetical protein